MRYLNAALPKRIDCAASTCTRVLARERVVQAEMFHIREVSTPRHVEFVVN